MKLTQSNMGTKLNMAPNPNYNDKVLHKIKAWTGVIIAIDHKNEKFVVRWKGKQTETFSFHNQFIMNLSAVKRENLK